jgi:hypothetical protein
MRSIREIELATFHPYNRRPKQPSRDGWNWLFAAVTSPRPREARVRERHHIAAQSTSAWLRCIRDASEASKKIWQMYSSVLAGTPSNQSKKMAGVLPTINYLKGWRNSER